MRGVQLTEKRFVKRYAGRTKKSLIGIEDLETNRVCVTIEENIRLLNELNDENIELHIQNDFLKDENQHMRDLVNENNQLKQRIEDLLYQIGEAGKNNKSCRECECFIPEHKYCYMWDMEVEVDDIVVACDQRKVKNTNGMVTNDSK